MTPTGPGASPVLASAVRAAVATVPDPEIDVSLADLGVLRSVRVGPGSIVVEMAPTRTACPGRDRMARDLRRVLAGVAPGHDVEIVWCEGAWRPDDVTVAGRRRLAEAGYALAGAHGAVGCPYCGSSDVDDRGRFGGGVCKAARSCRACGSPFDVLGSARCITALTGPARPPATKE